MDLQVSNYSFKVTLIASALVLEFLTWPYPFFFEAGVVVVCFSLFLLVPSHTDHYRKAIAQQASIQCTDTTTSCTMTSTESSSLLAESDVTATEPNSPMESEAIDTKAGKVNVFRAIYDLSRNPTYVFALLGYIFFDFVIGGTSFALLLIDSIFVLGTNGCTLYSTHFSSDS